MAGLGWVGAGLGLGADLDVDFVLPGGRWPPGLEFVEVPRVMPVTGAVASRDVRQLLLGFELVPDLAVHVPVGVVEPVEEQVVAAEPVGSKVALAAVPAAAVGAELRRLVDCHLPTPPAWGPPCSTTHVIFVR